MQFYARCQSQPGHFPAIPSRVLRVRDVQLVPRMAILVSRSHADGHPVRTTTRSGTVRTEPLADAYRLPRNPEDCGEWALPGSNR